METQTNLPIIHPGAHVHPDAVIGANTKVDAGAVIGPNVNIGSNCTICSGAVIGAIPFADAESSLCAIEIGDETLIGSNTSVQYGVTQTTEIGANCWINHGCCIGHDVKISDKVQVGLSSTVSGYSEVGYGVKIGPGCTLTNRSQVGDNATVGIGSLVLHPVSSGTTVLGRPAESRDQYLKATRGIRDLLNIERSNSRVTGGEKRGLHAIPDRIYKKIRRILGKA